MDLRDYLATKYSPAGADLAMTAMKHTLDRKGYDIVAAEYVEYMSETPFAITLRAKDGLVKSPDIPRRYTRWEEPERCVYTHRKTMDELRRFCWELPDAVPAPVKAANTLTAADIKRVRDDLLKYTTQYVPIHTSPFIPRDKVYIFSGLPTFEYPSEADRKVVWGSISAELRKMEEEAIAGKAGQPLNPTTAEPEPQCAEEEVAEVDEPAEEPEFVAQRCLSDIIAICHAMQGLIGAEAQPTHVANLAYDLDDRLTTLNTALDDLIDD